MRVRGGLQPNREGFDAEGRATGRTSARSSSSVVLTAAILASLAACLLLTFPASAHTPLGTQGPGFVEVSGTQFILDGGPFHHAGTNCYYLMVYAADPGLRPHVDEVLLEAAAMGLSVVRTWAFNDGSGWNALQTSPGVYDESVFQGLDYVLEKCRQLGLKVILPAVNNWVDYGGMDQYVAWSPTASFHDDFYTDVSCRTWYRDHLSTLIHRVNTVNGFMYRDDPTILAWELGNEPRCPSDKTGNTLQAWTEEMSAYIKSLDANHLVTTGSEGFYDDPSGPWYLNGWTGVDFIRNHQTPDIDFAVGHSWPDNYGLGFDIVMGLLSRQLTDANATIGKPFILEEFGKHRDGTSPPLARAHYDPRTYFSPGVSPYAVLGAEPVLVDPAHTARPYLSSATPSRVMSPSSTVTRDQFYTAYHDSVIAHRGGGAYFWILYHDAYPDYDGYGVYYPADVSTIAIIENFVAVQAARNVDLGPPVLGPVAITNVTLAHTDDYIKDGDAATVTATVTDDDPGFGIGNIVADLSGLGAANSIPDSYVGNVATWTLSGVTCTPGDGTVTVTVTATDAATNSASGNDDITADNTAPTAMTGFDAEPHHERVAMSWDGGGATDLNYRGVRVRYDVGGDYPNYATLGSYPADENGGGGDAFDGTGAVLGADHTIAARDIYYYTAFVYDQALNYGPAAASAQDRATNYWLGDVDVDTGPGGGDYDGDVDFDDINVLSATYFVTNPTSPGDECDVGPSDDATGTGIPQPDDNVSFEDLMLFAQNFGVVTPTSMMQPVALSGGAGSGPPMLRLEAAAATAEDDAGLAVRLVLDGNADQVKGASVVLHYDPATLTLADLSRSRALASGNRLLFFESRTAPGEIWLDLAAIGTGQTIHGSGTLAELRFTFKADGDRSVRFGAVKLRSVDNQELGAGTHDLALDPGTTLPTVTRLLGAAPNPFKPATSIRFELSASAHVTLVVYNVTGQLVRTLVDEQRQAGRFSESWDGRDNAGRRVPGGVYFSQIVAGPHQRTQKMVLLR